VSTEAITLELMPEAVAVIKQENLGESSAVAIQSGFAPHFAAAGEILKKCRTITVTDASQKAEIKAARDYRLALKNTRVAAEKTKKALKDESLRTGRAIDSFYNILLHLTASEEKRLQEQEDFAERQEAARKLALKTARVEELTAVQFSGAAFLALGEMPEAEYQAILEGAKLAHAAKLETAARAERERIAREKEEAAERERIRLENERLKAEAAKREAEMKAERERIAAEQKAKDEAARVEREAIEAKAKAEREAAEASAAKEREAREKLEAELKAKKDAEERKAAAERRAAKKAMLAPDSDKIRAFAGQIRALPTPAVISSEAASIVAQIKEQSEKFALWLEKKASELENPNNA
jgi:colicin import membrane protein